MTKHRWLGPCWILSIVVAAWLGSRTGGGAGRPAVAGPVTDGRPVEEGGTAAQQLARPAVARVRGGVEADELRRIVREELAAHGGACTPGAAGPGAAGDDGGTGSPPLDPALQADADEAAAIIARAVESGRWTADDRRRFASAAQALPPIAVIELQRTLHVSINRGQVTPADGLPPFGLADGP